MEGKKAKRISNCRASSASSKDFDFTKHDKSEELIDDPISVYFKQRCGNASKTYFKKNVESDSDSSIGCFDVDNVSLFGDGEGSENINPRLSENILEQLRSDSFHMSANKKQSNLSRTVLYSPESQIEKQRALAQKALKRISGKANETPSLLSPELSKEHTALSDISSKLINTKFSLGKKVEKNWFQPNYSPNTPRCFNDELSSIGGEDETPTTDTKRESQYVKKVNSILTELSQININPDITFESQTKEEQINRFEEDERKFKLESSGVMHNSQISQFSGTAGGDISQCSSENVKLQKSQSDVKNLSIGEFFTMRSNRISSLVGSEADDESSVCNSEQKSGSSPSLGGKKLQKILKNDYSLPINDTYYPEKMKPRRCLSTYDLKKTPNMTKTTRYSTDSSSSNSTTMIQNILAEMESGLSGTQIYEKLMKSYGKKKVLGKENQKKPEIMVGNRETPKSSKVQKRKEVVKNNMREKFELGPEKEVKTVEPRKSPVSDGECKRNDLGRDSRVNQGFSSAKNDRITKLKGRKGFDSSTPKFSGAPVKSQNDKFKTACSKVLMTEEDWEVPRISSIQMTIDLNKSEFSEDNDKTLMVNSTRTSSELSRKNCTILINDTLTIEDTIVAGDLTVLSQRIDEMKDDGVCIVRSRENEESFLLSVVQKLAELPKGTVDCSALTPLLRDQFPELLSTFPTPSKDASLCVPPPPNEKPQDVLFSKPGSWVKLPHESGMRQKIYVCAEVKKVISIPIVNITSKWLLVSIESLVLVHPNGKKLPGFKKDDEWTVFDFVTVSMKKTVVPPSCQQSLKVFFTPKIPTKLDLKLAFSLKDIVNEECQTHSVRIQTNNINPLNNLNVIPKDSINFGIIPDQCSDHRTVQVSFDGICELPLTVYIEGDESDSQQFTLKPYSNERELREDRFNYVFREGEKQVLEFRVIFQPHTFFDDCNKTKDFKALLIIKIGTKTDSDGILQKIPIKGSVGFTKFLCNPSCSPLVFRAPHRGNPITRSYPLKNVGSVPITFSLTVVKENPKTGEEEDNDNIFVAPKSFYLSRNQEAAIDITFNANGAESCVKRLLNYQMKPNGAIYGVELIGIISEGRPLSRTSAVSGLTKSNSIATSVGSSESVPVKLLTTAQSISWPAVPLEKESRQSFQIKNSSCLSATVRITFKKNLESFKFINENGEKVQKLRKVLKPDCPYTLTVAFRPDLVGAHHNGIFIELSQNNGRKVISLSGIGGVPSIFLGNVKSDLNGCKLLRLENSSNNNQFFVNSLEFKNEGRIPGFVLIKSNMEVFSLSQELIVTPSSCVIAPDSTVTVQVYQKLKSSDLQTLLSGRDISKLGTLSVITGDESSRQRLRKLVECGKVASSERINILTDTFSNEKEMSLKGFDDSPAFEGLFLKSLKTTEVAVVVERIFGICEPTMFEGEDTIDEFVTICSVNDTVQTSKSKKNLVVPNRLERQKSKNSDRDTAILSPKSLSPQGYHNNHHNKITKWLETLDCHSNWR